MVIKLLDESTLSVFVVKDEVHRTFRQTVRVIENVYCTYLTLDQQEWNHFLQIIPNVNRQMRERHNVLDPKMHDTT